MSKKSSTSFRSKSSDHVPIVPTMVSAYPPEFKRIHVFRNADLFFQGMQIVVNTNRTPSIDVLLDVISEKIGLVNGAKKLYTTNGVLIKDINKIKDGESYVASSSHFTPMAYGGQKVVKHRSKSVKKKHHKKKEHHEEHNEEKEHPEEIIIEEKVIIVPEHEKKLKKKKKKHHVKKHEKEEHHAENEREQDHHEEDEIQRRHSVETNHSGTAEVEIPSDHEHEHQSDHDDHEHHEEEHRPPTSQTLRPESRREKLTEHEAQNPSEDEHHEPKEEKNSKKEPKSKKSLARRKSQPPNWGDLSSFTKNIESLLKK